MSPAHVAVIHESRSSIGFYSFQIQLGECCVLLSTLLLLLERKYGLNTAN